MYQKPFTGSENSKKNSIKNSDCLITLQEHQSVLTNATVSKDSEIGILMVVYENFFY